MKDKILGIMREICVMSGGELGDVGDDTVLLESGLNSLEFATLVARLEDEFGYDPFTLMDVPSYPTTFGDFVALYQRYAP